MHRGPRNSHPLDSVGKRGHSALDAQLDDALALDEYADCPIVEGERLPPDVVAVVEQSDSDQDWFRTYMRP